MVVMQTIFKSLPALADVQTSYYGPLWGFGNAEDTLQYFRRVVSYTIKRLTEDLYALRSKPRVHGPPSGGAGAGAGASAAAPYPLDDRDPDDSDVRLVLNSPPSSPSKQIPVLSCDFLARPET